MEKEREEKLLRLLGLKGTITILSRYTVLFAVSGKRMVHIIGWKMSNFLFDFPIRELLLLSICHYMYRNDHAKG